MQREIITSKNQKILIQSDKENVVKHFESSANYADVILKQINSERLYDQWFANKSDLTILDIGANVGMFSLYVQDSAKAVYSIEPTPAHFEVLQELTKNYSNVFTHRLALHNEDGVVDFYICEGNTTCNSTTNKHDISIKVPSKKIGTILKDLNLDHVDFVKCDIEGSEITALTEETVSEVADKIDAWFLEIHATTWCPPKWVCNLQSNRDQLQNIFRKCGYKTSPYGHDSLYIFK